MFQKSGGNKRGRMHKLRQTLLQTSLTQTRADLLAAKIEIKIHHFTKTREEDNEKFISLIVS